MSISQIFLLVAVICFILDLFNVKIGSVKLQSLGLAFFAGALLVL
jgi:hypothetical protein